MHPQHDNYVGAVSCLRRVLSRPALHSTLSRRQCLPRHTEPRPDRHWTCLIHLVFPVIDENFSERRHHKNFISFLDKGLLYAKMLIPSCHRNGTAWLAGRILIQFPTTNAMDVDLSPALSFRFLIASLVRSPATAAKIGTGMLGSK